MCVQHDSFTRVCVCVCGCYATLTDASACHKVGFNRVYNGVRIAHDCVCGMIRVSFDVRDRNMCAHAMARVHLGRGFLVSAWDVPRRIYDYHRRGFALMMNGGASCCIELMTMSASVFFSVAPPCFSRSDWQSTYMSINHR